MSQATPSSIIPNIISACTARELVARGAVLLDVRSTDEFRNGHLTGALNIPLPELASRLDEIAPKERAVVVYCRSGRRSAEAARLLRQCDFRHVHDLGAMHR